MVSGVKRKTTELAAMTAPKIAGGSLGFESPPRSTMNGAKIVPTWTNLRSTIVQLSLRMRKYSHTARAKMKKKIVS